MEMRVREMSNLLTLSRRKIHPRMPVYKGEENMIVVESAKVKRLMA
jgi:hypothetical protein